MSTVWSGLGLELGLRSCIVLGPLSMVGPPDFDDPQMQTVDERVISGHEPEPNDQPPTSNGGSLRSVVSGVVWPRLVS